MKKRILSLFFIGAAAFAEAAEGGSQFNLTDLMSQLGEGGDLPDFSLLLDQLKDPASREVLLSMFPEELRKGIESFFERSPEDIEQALTLFQKDPKPILEALISSDDANKVVSSIVETMKEKEKEFETADPETYKLLKDEAKNFLDDMIDGSKLDLSKLVDQEGNFSLLPVLEMLQGYDFQDPALAEVVQKFMGRVDKSRLFPILEKLIDGERFYERFQNDAFFRKLMMLASALIQEIDRSDAAISLGMFEQAARLVESYINSNVSEKERKENLVKAVKSLGKAIVSRPGKGKQEISEISEDEVNFLSKMR